MALYNLEEVLKDAFEKGYSIPGFNFYTYEDAKAMVKGAEKLNSPIILMASGSCIKHLGHDLAFEIVNILAKRAKVPVVCHLDHADEMDSIYKAIKVGFTSVMYDGSILPVEENLKNTITVVNVAHAVGVSVEAEIGRVGKSEEGEDLHPEVLTEPEWAKNFAERSKVDALAVAVGTCHAMQKQEANLQLDRAKEINNVVSIPLVLHGSSGVKNEDLKVLGSYGFAKVNIGTKLKTTYADGIKEECEKVPFKRAAVNIFSKAGEKVTAVVQEKIRLLGSENKA